VPAFDLGFDFPEAGFGLGEVRLGTSQATRLDLTSFQRPDSVGEV
jgi:hypothetical protein